MSIADILHATSLEQVLTELTGPPAHPGSHRARWHCPERDHTDEHPSVTMNVSADGVERWKCWSGPHGGTAIDAIIAATGATIHEAVTRLEARTGTVQHTDRPTRPARQQQPPNGPSAGMRRWIEQGAHRLNNDPHQAAKRWLTNRGLSVATITANRLGYHPPRRSPADPDDRDGFPYSRCISIPAYDQSGELIWGQARNLDPDIVGYKYTAVARAHAPMPAVSFPRGGPTGGPLLVTEGILDGLTAIDAGYRAAAVTSVTTASYPATAATIATAANGRPIVIAFDNDTAGRDAAGRLYQRLRTDHPTIDVRRLELPVGHDLTDTRTAATGATTASATPAPVAAR